MSILVQKRVLSILIFLSVIPSVTQDNKIFTF